MTLIFTSFQTQGTMESWRLVCLRCSSGSKSDVVLPSSTRPGRLIAFAANSIASATDVLPAPECARSTTLRIRLVANCSTLQDLPRS